MKKYQGMWIPKKGNPSPEFKSECKCKRCKTTFTITLSENIEKKDVLIYKKNEEEVRTEYNKFLGFWNYSTKFTYERDVWEQVVLHKSICPNCGKKKKLFYVRYPERKFVYDEWQDVYDGTDCY